MASSTLPVLLSRNLYDHSLNMLFTSHVTRRDADLSHTGALLAARSLENKPDSGQAPISAIALLVFVLTVLVMSIIFSTLAYTYGLIVTTLTMVESPSLTAYVPIQNIEDEPPAYEEDGTPKPADESLVKTKPITSSLRMTINHLRERAGFWSRLRGLKVFIVMYLLRLVIVGMLSVLFGNTFVIIFGTIVAEVALANLHMTWIHVVISEPSTRSWWNRIPRPFGKTWKKIAPAVAIWAVADQAVAILPMLVTGSFGVLKHMQDPDFDPGMKEAYMTAAQLFFALVLMLLLFVVVEIPATVAMVRVAASMLPEEDETIVPFDRTFSGLVTPEIIGGQGKVGIAEAWKSFNWECRRRLLRTTLKIVAMFSAVYLLFSIILMTEAHRPITCIFKF